MGSAYEPLTDCVGFGAALRRSRKEMGLTLEELALQVGYSARLVGEAERGVRTLPLDKALRLARTVGIDLFYKVR